VRRLEEIADRAADVTVDAEAVLKLDFEFYVELTRIGHNRVFQLLINTIRGAVLNYSAFFVTFNPPAAVVRKHHRDVIKAVEAHDGEKAALTADAHLRKGAEQLFATLKVGQPGL
jgi:DNA-binding FadR family transcriptional regulator